MRATLAVLVLFAALTAAQEPCNAAVERDGCTVRLRADTIDLATPTLLLQGQTLEFAAPPGPPGPPVRQFNGV